MAASFNVGTAQGTQLRMWYGKVQQILQIRLLSGAPQLFLKVDWYKAGIVGPDPGIAGMTRIKCRGQGSYDMDRREPFIHADKIDCQVFFVPIPAHLTNQDRPWVWVCQDVSSSYRIPEHLLDGDGDVVDEG